jgi:hypothetical protein
LSGELNRRLLHHLTVNLALSGEDVAEPVARMNERTLVDPDPDGSGVSVVVPLGATLSEMQAADPFGDEEAWVPVFPGGSCFFRSVAGRRRLGVRLGDADKDWNFVSAIGEIVDAQRESILPPFCELSSLDVTDVGAVLHGIHEGVCRCGPRFLPAYARLFGGALREDGLFVLWPSRIERIFGIDRGTQGLAKRELRL